MKYSTLEETTRKAFDDVDEFFSESDFDEVMQNIVDEVDIDTIDENDIDEMEILNNLIYGQVEYWVENREEIYAERYGDMVFEEIRLEGYTD